VHNILKYRNQGDAKHQTFNPDSYILISMLCEATDYYLLYGQREFSKNRRSPLISGTFWIIYQNAVVP